MSRKVLIQHSEQVVCDLCDNSTLVDSPGKVPQGWAHTFVSQMGPGAGGLGTGLTLDVCDRHFEPPSSS